MAESAGDLFVRIVAVNEASPQLTEVSRDSEKVAQALRAAGEKSAQGADLTSRGLRDVARTTKLAAGSIATELNPALGQLVNAMSSASREGLRFSLGTSAALVGVSAAGAVIAKLVRDLNRTTEQTAKLNLAVRAVDVGSLRSQAAELALALEKISIAREQGGLTRGLAEVELFFRNLFQSIKDEQQAITKALNAIQGPIRERQELENALKLIDARQQLAAIEANRARETEDLQAFNFETGRQTVLISQQAQAAENLARAKAEALVRQPLLTDEEFETIRLGLEQEVEAIRAAERVRQAANFAAVERGRLDLAEARGRRLAAEAEAGPFPGQAGREAAEIARREDLATARELLAEEQKRADLRTRLVELSQAERDQLELAALAARQRAVTEDETLTTQQRQTKELEVQLDRTNLAMRQAARENPLVGLSLGLRDVVEQFGEVGVNLRSAVQRMGQDMSQAFSDTFVAVITGEFKKLPDLPKLLAQAVIREFAQAAGQLAVGGLARGFFGR